MSMPEKLIDLDARGDAKKVLVLETDQVFGGILLNLIANQAHLVTTSLRVNPQTDLAREVSSRNPDVLVVDDSIFSQIDNRLFSLLQQFPDLKIVVLCTEANHVEVYTKQQTIISRSQDFFNVL
jgi:hypothetical protein